MALMTTPAPPGSSFDESCPVCKSSRYLNPNIRFLMSSVCYHKMCESCVLRLFGSGPGPCPIVSCQRKLHRNKFRKQLFEDVSVEREVDVRRRIGKIYNRRVEEFKDKRVWDDYLENVEGLVYSLVNGDAAEQQSAEEEVKAYETENKKRIRENANKERSERERAVLRKKDDERAVLEEREMIKREEDAEKEEVEKARYAQLEAMARGDVTGVAQIKKKLVQAQKDRKIRVEAQMEYFRVQREGKMAALATLNTIDEDDIENAPRIWKPLGTGYVDRSQWVSVQEEYENQWLDPLKKDSMALAGGFSILEYYQKSLFEAFSGLTVFVGDGESQEDLARAYMIKTD